MESMESHEAGFPLFPHSLEIPAGFPHSHGLDDWIYPLVPLETRIIATARGLLRMSQVHNVTMSRYIQWIAETGSRPVI
jgi:hypothetical protein